jgi:O-antigen ligase
MKSGKKSSRIEFYALAFGLFLGLCIWKFGNPVILDSKIPMPVLPSDFLNDPWPTRWANWILLPIALAGGAIAFSKKLEWPGTKWLWLLPLLWLGWQLFSATQTVDASLTATTLWQFFGCVACYFLGAFVLGSEQMLHWLMIGVLAAFTLCLVRSVDQRLFEFPQSRQMLIEGERAGWTNYPPETILEMKRENVIITTNGVDVANPAILAKFGKEPPMNANRLEHLFYKLFAPSPRVNGTLVYPNALAGAILLLFPISLVLAFQSAKQLRPLIRASVIALAFFLGGAGFFWTGSKLGWLIAIALGGVWLFRLKCSAQFKRTALAIVLLIGLGIFAVRFHNYFAAGATSASARLDYWRAAAQTTFTHPVFGTGPGTFQRPYAQLKSPTAEMARLTHNDYLEQFSDSGIAGGIFYAAWIGLSLVVIGRRVWTCDNPMVFAIFAGLLGWFIQGIGEFGLYIPAPAWTAFTLLGCLFGRSGNQIDKLAAAN